MVKMKKKKTTVMFFCQSCVYLCVHGSAYVCICEWMNECTYVCMCACLYVCTYACMNARMHECIYVSMYVCVYICICIWIYEYIPLCTFYCMFYAFAYIHMYFYMESCYISLWKLLLEKKCIHSSQENYGYVFECIRVYKRAYVSQYINNFSQCIAVCLCLKQKDMTVTPRACVCVCACVVCAVLLWHFTYCFSQQKECLCMPLNAEEQQE